MLRILTENKNKGMIEADLIARGIDFTIYEAQGVWEGIREDSLVIDIEGYSRKVIFEAADAIRLINNQEAVYVQDVPSTLYSITEKGRKCLTP